MQLKNSQYPIIIALYLLFVSCNVDETGINQTLESTISNPITTSWLGFGYNQDPLDRDEKGHNIGTWDNGRWNLTKERIDYIKPSFVRIVLYRHWFNPSGVIGEYDWNSPKMLSLYQVLDYYKEKNIPVMTGLWQSTLDFNDNVPFYTSEGSDSFQKLQVDMFQQLFKIKGYQNMRWYTPTNEPKGMGMDFQKWSQMMKNTYNGFSAADLPLNIFCGADSWDEWTSNAAIFNKNELSGYDHHYYLNSGLNQLIFGGLEEQFRDQVASIKKIDNSGKPVFLSEAGFTSTSELDYWYVLNPIPTLNPTSTKYGLLALDYGIQVARSGESGALAWSLDGYDYGKDPGMWNIAGYNGGIKLRPWYYSWSTLCRYFPAGGIVYAIEFNIPSFKVRGVAMEQRIEDKSHWTFAFVNWGETEISTNFSIPNFKGGDFVEFQFSASSSGDGISLSLPKQGVTINSLKDGFLIKIPASGGLIITSMENMPIAKYDPSK
jgi:hypothetical protein